MEDVIFSGTANKTSKNIAEVSLILDNSDKDGPIQFKELDMDYIDGVSFNRLLNMQANATINSVKDQKDIPCDVITIRTVDEYNIAKLMFTYQLLVSCIGKFLQINTYDQPAVEYGKNILIERLK